MFAKLLHTGHKLRAWQGRPDAPIAELRLVQVDLIPIVLRSALRVVRTPDPKRPADQRRRRK